MPKRFGRAASNRLGNGETVVNIIGRANMIGKSNREELAHLADAARELRVGIEMARQYVGLKIRLANAVGYEKEERLGYGRYPQQNGNRLNGK